MKAWRITALFMMGMILSLNRVCARPVDFSTPSAGLGVSNSHGYLDLWREVGGVGLQLGKDLYLPLQYKFSSEPGIGGMLGPGFYVPMFESREVLIREQMMRAFLPCGKGLYLRRDMVDPHKFQTLDGEWTGWLDGDDFTLWCDDGWKLLYHKNRLTSLVTDDNHTFTWTYDQGGMPTGVSEDGQSVITIEQNVAGQVAAFVFNGKRYEVTYAERPVTEMLLGQPAIKELDQALSSFKYPDGRIETFNFVVTPNLTPTVTFTNIDKKQTLYTWDPATDYIATEKGPGGSWTYKIGEITQNLGLPPISRTSSDGTTEGIAVDTKMGTYTQQLTNGVTTITHVFETPGPLYNKVRAVEKVSNGQTTTIYKASYDELGRLIRKMDQKGFVTEYRYNNNDSDPIAQHTSLLNDSQLINSLKLKEGQLLQKLQQPRKNGRVSDEAIQDLVLFYIYSELDFQKAVPLINQLHNPNRIFNLKLVLIVGNPNLTSSQRNAALNDLIKEFPKHEPYIKSLMYE